MNPAPSLTPGVAMPSYTTAAPYYPGYPPPFYPYYQSPAGATLQGLASYTQASGQYWQSIQQARITREMSRQAAIDTQRKQLEWEMEYEKLRPTAPKMRRAEQATDLEWAHNDPPKTEIWSGSTLNVLLQSILKSPQPVNGPQIPLDDTIVNGLNLTDKTTRGNLALAKDEGKIAWTEALQEATYDDVRERFSKNFDTAIKSTQSGQTPPIPILRDLRTDLKVLDEKLDDQVRDLSPGKYIEARRLLNQLKNTIKGLSDPRICKACQASWKKNVRTVADLVAHCMKNGVEFGPAAAPGDEACYTAAYYALRNYERGIWVASSR